MESRAESASSDSSVESPPSHPTLPDDIHQNLLSDRALLMSLPRRRGPLRQTIPRYNHLGNQTFCFCDSPDDGLIMLQCDTCKQWLHGACIGITEEMSSIVDVYICKGCHEFIKGMGIDTPTPNTHSLPIKVPVVVKPAVTNSSHPVEKRPGLIDKTRKMAKTNFTQTFQGIFNNVLNGKIVLSDACSVDLHAPDSYAKALEEELFTHHAEMNASDVLECGQKSKYRSIQFNLKDPQNTLLRSRILTCLISPLQLVTLSPEDLASDEIKEKVELSRRVSMLETVIIKPDDAEERKHVAELLMVNIDLGRDAPAELDVEPLFTPPVSALTPVSGFPFTLRDANPYSPEAKRQKMSNGYGIPEFEDAYTTGAIDDIYISHTPASPLPQSPTHSPVPHSPLPMHDYPSMLWQGTLTMPTIASFRTECTQIAGLPVPAHLVSQLLQPELLVEGRIEHPKVLTFLDNIHALTTSTKHIILLKFTPLSDDAAFNTLHAYFLEKQRYAVMLKASKLVKEFYLFPASTTTPLPPIFRKLGYTQDVRSDTFFGAMVCTRYETAEKPRRTEVVVKKEEVPALSTPALQALLQTLQTPDYSLYAHLNTLMNKNLQ